MRRPPRRTAVSKQQHLLLISKLAAALLSAPYPGGGLQSTTSHWSWAAFRTIYGYIGCNTRDQGKGVTIKEGRLAWCGCRPVEVIQPWSKLSICAGLARPADDPQMTTNAISFCYLCCFVLQAICASYSAIKQVLCQ